MVKIGEDNMDLIKQKIKKELSKLKRFIKTYQR